jgi:hypothetical protein
MRLLFNPAKLPRTMTRKEWKEIDRWRRVVTRKLRESLEQRLSEVFIRGGEKFLIDVLDEAVNPPLLLGPYQESTIDCTDIVPGKIASTDPRIRRRLP